MGYGRIACGQPLGHELPRREVLAAGRIGPAQERFLSCIYNTGVRSSPWLVGVVNVQETLSPFVRRCSDLFFFAFAVGGMSLVVHFRPGPVGCFVYPSRYNDAAMPCGAGATVGDADL